MPIVMNLGFGEDGDAGDRGTVSKQATREHEVYPGSGPQRENPTPACLLLITVEPEVTGVRRCNLAWRRHGPWQIVEWAFRRAEPGILTSGTRMPYPCHTA